MNNIVGFAFLAFALTGILMTTSMSESFAAKGGNGSENANTQSCENPKGQAPSKNPNCSSVGGDSDGDGLSDDDELALAQSDPVTYGCLDINEFDSDGDTFSDSVDAFPCMTSQH